MGAESELPVADLAERCAEETAKFVRRAASDTRFCVELLRRALVDRSPEAFTHVYRVYEQLVTSWVYRHSRFALTGESAEYFTSAAFRSFYFALAGDRFAQFPSLAALLNYLKMCVHTAIAQHLREVAQYTAVPLEEITELPEAVDPDAQVEAEELWARICRLLPDERDQLLARCAFVQGLKPREIAAAHPTAWRSTREVSVTLYKVRRMLRADPEIAARAGLALVSEATGFPDASR
jgi:hypothetical protein